MSIRLPDPIPTILAVSNDADTAQLAQCLVTDAVVHDEQRTHQGHAAIHAWLGARSAAISTASSPWRLRSRG